MSEITRSFPTSYSLYKEIHVANYTVHSLAKKKKKRKTRLLAPWSHYDNFPWTGGADTLDASGEGWANQEVAVARRRPSRPASEELCPERG